MELYERIRESVEALKPHLNKEPRIALVLGSGLGDLAQAIDVDYELAYADIPGFKPSGMPTHAGKLIFGDIMNQAVVCMQGRTHLYEGYSPEEITYPLFVMHALGAQDLIITNASGGITSSMSPGSIAVITDHINNTGLTPFSYHASYTNSDSGERVQIFNPCPDMTHAYTPALRCLAQDTAANLGMDPLPEGVYVGVHGPQFETPAEIQAFGRWGADIVGMSTVQEVIVARALSMRILGLSLVTNWAAGISTTPLTGAEIYETAMAASKRFCTLVKGILSAWPD